MFKYKARSYKKYHHQYKYTIQRKHQTRSIISLLQRNCEAKQDLLAKLYNESIEDMNSNICWILATFLHNLEFWEGFAMSKSDSILIASHKINIFHLFVHRRVTIRHKLLYGSICLLEQLRRSGKKETRSWYPRPRTPGQHSVLHTLELVICH